MIMATWAVPIMQPKGFLTGLRVVNPMAAPGSVAALGCRRMVVNGTTKFIIGAVATSLMAMASHSVLGLGQGFIGGLQTEANARLASSGLAGVTAAMETKPALERVVLLSGPASDADKARLIAAMKAIPGVKDARWVEDGAPPVVSAAAPETPAAPEIVQACQTDVNTAISGKTIPFDVGRASLKVDAAPVLDAVAASLKACSGIIVEVAGHTDPTGQAAANQTLSEARAAAVASALTQRGVPAGRLTAKGYGSSQPKAQGSSPEAYAQDRRIEFTVASAAPAASAT